MLKYHLIQAAIWPGPHPHGVQLAKNESWPAIEIGGLELLVVLHFAGVTMSGTAKFFDTVTVLAKRPAAKHEMYILFFII